MMIRSKLMTLKAPLTVVYEATPVCNYHCSFCYAATDQLRTHPPGEHVVSILDRLAQSEVYRIIFMGGEFFLHPDWREILAHARRLGLDSSFISNGSCLTEETCRALEGYVGSGAISLHGADSGVHDRLAGHKGAFAAALQATKTCQRHGIRMSVLCTPTRENYSQLWEMARTLAENEVFPDLINVSRLTPQGRAREHWEAIRLGLEHYLALFGQAARIKADFGISVHVGDGFPRCQVPNELVEFLGRCDAGITLAAIGYQGELKLCPNSEESLGNILKTPLPEIWQQAEPLLRLRELDWLPVPCQSCVSASSCKSGCIVSRPETRDFGCDAIPPADAGLREEPGRQREVPASSSTVEHVRAVSRPKFTRRYHIREDVPGTLLVLENGGWSFVSNLDRAVIELCDGRHALDDFYRAVAAQECTTPDLVQVRVDATLAKLTRSGLCVDA